MAIPARWPTQFRTALQILQLIKGGRAKDTGDLHKVFLTDVLGYPAALRVSDPQCNLYGLLRTILPVLCDAGFLRSYAAWRDLELTADGFLEIAKYEKENSEEQASNTASTKAEEQRGSESIIEDLWQNNL